MAGVKLQVSTDAKKAIDGLNRIVASLTNPSPLLGDIGEHLLISHRERFDKAEDPEGNPWAPLSPAYLESKRKRKSRHPRDILVRDEHLRALHYQVSGKQLWVGTNREYGAVHQFGAEKGEFGTTSRGAPIPWGDIPARPFLGLSGDDETAIRDIINDGLQAAAAGG